MDAIASGSHIGKEGTGAVMRLTGPGEEPHAAAVLRSWRASAAGNCVDWKVYRVRRAVFWHPMVRKNYHSGRDGTASRCLFKGSAGQAEADIFASYAMVPLDSMMIYTTINCTAQSIPSPGSP